MKERFKVFDLINYVLLTLFCFTTFYPFWQQLVVSLSTPQAYYRDWYHLIPTSFSLHGYMYNLSNPQVIRSFFISVFVTVFGTVSSLVMCLFAAYFLSKSYLRLRNLIFFLFILTNFIRGGLIPFYITVTKLGMRNSYFALFIPYLIEIYYIVLLKNYFQNMNTSLEESAKLDGASDLQVLFRIVAPTAKPILAAIGLFISVRFWNDWLPGMIFLSDNRMYPMALYLRNIIINYAGMADTAISDIFELQEPAIARAAVIMITTIPIIMVYPFLQKHFVQGIMIGAVRY